MDRSLVQMVACSAPAFRSTSMVICRPVRSTPSRGSPIEPPRHTMTPLMDTSTWSAWNAASVVPTAASTRPQLGSLPNRAVLSRLLRAQARPAASASATLAALCTVIAMSFVEPSASASSCIARSVAAAVSASVSSSAVGVTPLAPLATASTVSLVDRQPSESTRSTPTPGAASGAVCSTSAGTTASVVRTTSIVASDGASMPAPLAIPPIVQPSPRCTVVLGTESVVMIARAASSPPSSASPFTAAVTPGSSLSIGSRTPISPVEATATSIAPMPSSAARCSAVAWVSWKPSGPVQALAPPEFSTTARSRPDRSTCRLHWTGAAGKRLVVKTAAPASSGPSLTTTATSSAPLDFSPAGTPAARKPCGAVTLMRGPPRERGAPAERSPGVGSRCNPHDRQARRLGEAEGEVGALESRSPGALGQVVHRGDDNQPAGIGVDGDLQRDGVGAEHLGGGRPLALRQEVHERLVGVGLGVDGPGGVRVRARCQRRGAGGEDAAAHRHEGRREADGDRRPGGSREVLDHLRGVPVDPADAVGADRAHDLAAEQVRLERLARTGRPAGGHHDDLGPDEAGGEGRCQRERDRGRVTAGDGDPRGAGQLLTLPGQLRQAVGPGAGVLAPVPACPGGRVVQPVVGAAVDDQGVLRELGGDGRGLPVRQCEHDDVVPHQGGRIAPLHLEIGEGQQVRLQLTQAPAGARVGVHPGQAEVRVPGEEPAHLPARVPGGAGDPDRPRLPCRHDA